MALNRRILVGTLFLLTLLTVAGSTQIPGSLPTMDVTNTDLGGGNSIAGTIMLANGSSSRRGIRVRLVSMTRGESSAITDEYGNYWFRGLPAGDYTVAVDREKEFEPVSADVRIIQLRGMPSQTFLLNLKLLQRQNSAAKPGVLNASLASVPAPALTLYEKGGELAAQGNRKEAIEKFRAAINIFPSFAQAYNDLGVQYMKLGEIVNADEAFVSAIKIEPSYYNALLNHGMATVMVRQYAGAEPIFRKAIELRHNQAAGHYFLGQTLANLNRFDEAERELKEAVKLGSNEMSEAYRILAILHITTGKRPEAAADLEQYLKLNPNAPDAAHLRELIKQYMDEPGVRP